MTKKILFSSLLIVFFIAPAFFAFSKSSPLEKWWDKFGEPQYGGKITVQLSSIRPNFDTFSFFPGDWHMVYEALFAQESWTVDRNEYPFNADFVPMKYFSGELAESWEMTDPTTMVVRIRQGVRWQNKPPVNGREFTANDVQAHYDRVVFSPIANSMYKNNLSLLESVIATDRYTLKVKFKKPGVVALWQFMDQVPWSLIEAPEYAALYTPPAGGPPPGGPPPGGKKGPPPGGPPPGGPPIMGAGGPLQDWRNIVGTGPWMLTDYVSGSSMTLSKNPDYWGFDERHPENQLPYADTLKALVITDISTSIAALRTGKIDIIGGGGGGQSPVSWQQVSSLLKSNPDLKVSKIPSNGLGIQLRVDQTPFTDINVRKALNMAIDRPTIAKSYYGGTEDGIPAGIRAPVYKGWNYPYNEWSQTLKDIYSYNPARAKQLLTEAGYPNGFKTECVAATNADLQLLQILKAYLQDVGVDMSINAMDPTSWRAYVTSRKTKQMMYGAGGGGTATFKPNNSIYRYYSKDMNQNIDAVNDSNYDALVHKFNDSRTEKEAAAASIALDKYGLEQAWTMLLFPINTYVFHQPYLKGYSGENIMWNHWYYYTARWWIDKSMKK